MSTNLEVYPMRSLVLFLAMVTPSLASAAKAPVEFRTVFSIYGAQAILHNAAVPPQAIRYNAATGKCVDSANRPGLNDPKLTSECGDFKEQDLSNKDLSKQNLRGANLDESKVKAANFKQADLRGAKLNFTNYKDAEFKGALISPDTELPFPKEKALALGMIWVEAKALDQLFIDCSRGDLEMLRGILALGADPHAQEDLVFRQFIRDQNVERLTVLKKLGLDMATALHVYFSGLKLEDFSDKKQESKFMADLIALGANLDYSLNGESLIVSLLRLNRPALAKELIAAGASLQLKGDQINVLTAAIEYARYPFVFWLLQNGADPNLCTDRSEAPLSAAVRRFPTSNEVAEFPKEEPSDLLELFLKYGAQPNTVCKTGLSPLAAAFESKRYPSAKKLIDLKADPNVCDKAGNCSVLSKMVSVRGTLPLDVVQALIDAGADGAWGKAKGINLLDSVGGANLLAELVRAGADPTTARVIGRTDLDSVRYLLEHGANAEAVSSNKVTLLMSAIFAKNKPLVEYLLKSPKMTPALLNAKNADGSHAVVYVVFYMPAYLSDFLMEKRLNLSNVTFPVQIDVQGRHPMKKQLFNVPIAHWAISRRGESREGNEKLVKLVAARGASLNEIHPHTKELFLQAAMEYSSDNSFIEELIALGADPKKPELLFSLAHRFRSFNGWESSVYIANRFVLLLDHGADPNASTGESILSRIAMSAAPWSLAEKLLEKGAKPTIGLVSQLLQSLPSDSQFLASKAAVNARKSLPGILSYYGKDPVDTLVSMKEGLKSIASKACSFNFSSGDMPPLLPNQDLTGLLADYLAVVRKGSFKAEEIDEGILSGILNSYSADGFACESALYSQLKRQLSSLPTGPIVEAISGMRWPHAYTPAAVLTKTWVELSNFLDLLEADGAKLKNDAKLVSTLVERYAFPLAWKWLRKGAPFTHKAPKISALKKTTMTAANFESFFLYGGPECDSAGLASGADLFQFAIDSGGVKSSNLLVGIPESTRKAFIWNTMLGTLRIEELSKTMKDLQIEHYCIQR
jgi:ankyrin repeat protein